MITDQVKWLSFRGPHQNIYIGRFQSEIHRVVALHFSPLEDDVLRKLS